MNKIRQIQEWNKLELENQITPNGSWHVDFRDTAWVYIGGLPFELSEGDIVTIFSQYGEPTFINLVRDKETGKSKGFAFLKYEDQRSCDLAVDNLGGMELMGRTVLVDHTRYKRKDGEVEGMDLTVQEETKKEGESESEEERPMIKEERELALLMRDHDEDDPMKAFLVQEKKDEVAVALARVKGGKKDGKSERSHKHRHRHHRSRREEGGEEGRSSRRREDDRRDRDMRGEDDRRDRDRRRSTSRDRKRSYDDSRDSRYARDRSRRRD